jgi:hypothetical protein
MKALKFVSFVIGLLLIAAALFILQKAYEGGRDTGVEIREQLQILYPPPFPANFEVSWVDSRDNATISFVSTTSDDGKYFAVVTMYDNVQKVSVLNNDFVVVDSFEVNVSEYGEIKDITALMVTDKGAKMILVTSDGHFARHFPEDGSPSPAIDLIK